jgi:hypothetical protein
MNLETVEVSARWDQNSKFEPIQFNWQGKLYQIESTGRDWEDDSGYHVLCMVFGGNIFELIFHLQPAGWWIRPVNGLGIV